jgi:ubiquinone/menaquinone biosynthesis C-methylase UbiE
MSADRGERLRRSWDRQAATFDDRMTPLERRFLADTRSWLCGQATGEVLEVAIGTGLNLPHYPASARLTGVEWSAAMLEVARDRAERLRRPVELHRADARHLRFPDARFDTVVCTFSLCGIPDPKVALAEMARVLRPGGLLLLADHVGSSVWPVRLLQVLADAVTVPWQGEHWCRRPLPWVRELGLRVERHDRFGLGIIERLAARAPDR